MKYNVVEKTFVDKNGKSVKFNQCQIVKDILGVRCELVIKPRSEERIIKTMLVNNYLQADVQLKITNKNNDVYKSLIVKLGNDEIPLYATSSDIALFMLMEKSIK